MWSHPHTKGIGNTGQINFRTQVQNKVAKTWTRWMIWLSNVMNRHSINRVDNRNRIGLSAALFLLAQPFSLKLARCQIQIQSLRLLCCVFSSLLTHRLPMAGTHTGLPWETIVLIFPLLHNSTCVAQGFSFFFMFGLDLQPNTIRSWLGLLTYTNKMCYFPQP